MSLEPELEPFQRDVATLERQEDEENDNDETVTQQQKQNPPKMGFGAPSSMTEMLNENTLSMTSFNDKGNPTTTNTFTISKNSNNDELPRAPWLPFVSRPAALDGSLAADVGFDPLGLAKTKEQVLWMREAEIKHSRLAMLAVVGWPLSELYDKTLAEAWNLPTALVSNGRAPSLLNGGLLSSSPSDESTSLVISPNYWIGCLAVGALLDFWSMYRSQQQSNNDYFPGNMGMDLFGLYPSSPEAQMWMQTAELKHGRLAMLAITGFAFQEFIYETSVIDQTPFFFKPLTQLLEEYSTTGYIL